MPSKINGPIDDAFITNVIQQTDRFLVTDPDLSQQLLQSTKWLFDQGISSDCIHFLITCSGKSLEPTFSPLNELLIDGFDDAQVWEQMMLEYGPKLNHVESEIAQLGSDTGIMDNESTDIEQDAQEESQSVSEPESHLEELDQQSDSERASLPDMSAEEDQDQELNGEDSEDDQDESAFLHESKPTNNGIDDAFFSLDAMEKFADMMEEREDKKRKRDETGQDERDEDDFMDSGMVYQETKS